MLQLSVDYEKGFCDLYNSFNSSEKRKKLLQLSGISRDELDFCTMSKKFFETKTSDMSLDPNANVGQNKSFNTYSTEIFKGALRLNGYYLMWKYLVKDFGEETANDIVSKCISGFYYPHDLTKWTIPYCIGVSTYELLVSGRPFGDLHSIAPKRSDSFISQVIETTMDLSQNFAGAVALADLFVNYTWLLRRDMELVGVEAPKLSHVLRSDMDLRKKVTNEFQRFTHTVNNKFRVGGDSLYGPIKIRVYKVKNRRKVLVSELFSELNSKEEKTQG